MNSTAKTREGDAAQVETAEKAAAPARLIGKPEVLDRVGASYPTIWQMMRDGKFPRSRSLGGKAMWVEAEIEAWILARPVRRLKGDGA
jgi:prophage regulatory protein